MLRRTVPVLTVLALVCALPTIAWSDPCPNEAIREQQSSGYLPDCRAYEVVSGGADKDGNDLTSAHYPVSLDGDRVVYQAYTPFGDATQGGGSVNGLDYLAARNETGWKSTFLARFPTPNPTTNANFNPVLLGASPDLSSMYFAVEGSEDPGAWLSHPDGSVTHVSGGERILAGSQDGKSVVMGDGEDLFEYAEGVTTQVNVDDAGHALEPAVIGDQFSNARQTAGTNTVSADGSRVFFQVDEGEASGGSQLFERVAGRTTVAVSASVHSAPVPPLEQVHFVNASADGTRAFFITTGELTDDASGPGPFLYEFYLPQGASSGTLKLIGGGQHPIAIEGANPRHGEYAASPQVLVSDDGSHVYYASGDEGGSLFLYHVTGAEAGETDVVARGIGTEDAPLNGGIDSSDRGVPATMTPDGEHLVFSSAADLVAGDTNTEPQLYKYDDQPGGGQLTLLSTGPSARGSYESDLVNSANDPLSLGYGASSGAIPANYHGISDNGSYVFFESFGSLVPADTNGQGDVYEWHDGTVSLVSTGTGTSISSFVGASADGSDVFFTTRDDLVAQDGDDSLDVYDARVNGGFLASSPLSCDGEGCQGTPSGSPTLPVAASVTFAGAGNASVLPGGGAGGPRTRTLGKVKLSRANVKGSLISLRVQVPAGGRISASGLGLRSTARSIARAGSYVLQLRLSPAAKETLERRHELRVKVRVRYAPSVGSASSATVSVTVKA